MGAFKLACVFWLVISMDSGFVCFFTLVKSQADAQYVKQMRAEPLFLMAGLGPLTLTLPIKHTLPDTNCLTGLQPTDAHRIWGLPNPGLPVGCASQEGTLCWLLAQCPQQTLLYTQGA